MGALGSQTEGAPRSGNFGAGAVLERINNMESNLVHQIAEKVGFTVTLDEFISCGSLHATAIGLARCQSELLVSGLRIMDRDLKTKKASLSVAERFADTALTFVLMMLCADDEGTVSMTDDEGGEFLHRNHHLLARLFIPAYAAMLPKLSEAILAEGAQQ